MFFLQADAVQDLFDHAARLVGHRDAGVRVDRIDHGLFLQEEDLAFLEDALNPVFIAEGFGVPAGDPAREGAGLFVFVVRQQAAETELTDCRTGKEPKDGA